MSSLVSWICKYIPFHWVIYGMTRGHSGGHKWNVKLTSNREMSSTDHNGRCWNEWSAAIEKHWTPMIIVVDISSAVRVRHGDNEKKYKRSSCTSTTFRNVITWNTPRRDKKMNRAYTRSTCKVDSKYLSYISTASQQQKEKRSSHIVEHELIPPSDHHIPINLNNAVFCLFTYQS